MKSQVEAAAYHEAGHVVGLRHCGQSVHSASVNDDGSGDTIFEDLPTDDKDVILVILAGMHAEPNPQESNIQEHIRQFQSTAASANSDMKALIEHFEELWLAQSSLWHQTQHNRAEKFVQDHKEQIVAVAEAILAKPGFPKLLDGTEIDKVLSNH